MPESMYQVFLFFGIVALFLLGAFFAWWLWRRRKKRIVEELQIELFLVKLPYQPKEGRDLKKETAVFEQFIAALATFKKPFCFEAAVPAVGEEIHFFVAAPRRLGPALVRQVHGLWAEAEVERVHDYTIFHPTGTYVGGTVKYKDRFVLPIRTYQEFDADSMSPILSGLTRVREIGEGAVVQIVVRPATAKRLKKAILTSIDALRRGGKRGDVIAGAKITLGDVVKTVAPPKDTVLQQERMQPRVVDDAAIKALEKKASRPLFRVNIRCIASAPTAAQAEDILNAIQAGFSQFGSPERNDLVFTKAKQARELAHDFTFRAFRGDGAIIMNSEELASLYHFPTPFTDVPRLKGLKAKQAPPPPALEREGVMVGESMYRGDRKEVRIADDDRRRHIYVIGQTGTGKSNLITNMAAYDIAHGKGVAVIDPHGDLIHKILARVPKERFEDVIVFDPGDLERPIGINMIEYNPNRPEEKTFIVNEMVGIFDKLYDLKVTGGPMFEQYMRNALLLLMEDAAHEPATLMEVPRVFTDALYRKRKLERIKNPIVMDFWLKEAEKAGGEAALQNITPYVTSKFNNFTANDYMRVIVGQERSAFDFRKVMDEGKILLVNLSKGRIGDINANLLGMIFVGKILMAALSRGDMPEETRRDFNLYIDEFQNFTTDSISTILSEARKYRLNLVIAHQFIAQLSEKIRDAVFGNVGSLLVFRVGVQDAEFLKKEFAPVFTEHDLANIDNFNAYAKLLIRGETSKPFNIKTIPAEKGNAEIAAALAERSRLKYGRDRAEVEESVFRRLRG